MNKATWMVLVPPLALFISSAIAQQSALKVPESMPPVYQARLDNAATFFEAIEDADAVIHVVIDHAVALVTTDGFAESFSILHVNGVVATGDGVEALPASYKLRLPGGMGSHAAKMEGTEWVYFVKNNRIDYNPIRRSHTVREGVVYSHRNSTKAIRSISESGVMYEGPRFNTCEQAEYLERYNPDEDLSLVLSFTCADGSQWNAGNDRPDDYVESPVTPELVLAMASEYLARHNLPTPDLSRGVGPVSHDVSLRPENRLGEWSEFRDDIYRLMLETSTDEQWAIINRKAPEKNIKMQEFVKRELARGKTEDEIPLRARTVLPYVLNQLDDK